ncbi:MAG: DNA polymerase III subunit gamma/tau [Rhizomicrobium sp.]
MDENQTPSLIGDDMPNPQKGVYQVLARKYRPSDFTGLIGQEILVRTLSNAFASGRIAHAFMLTGVRGVGKTTTARIIARALNCIGPDGKADKPNIHPCGVCEPCRAIAESRHVDVQEMDAASRTGIDDVREIIEGVRYAPASARYKVYIIDEVHMLSKQAFNGLLKTLEEPPPHVKFIFATTEIRKVPVTVLSRCQRFDLRRVETAEMATHLRAIADQEHVAIEDGALNLVARAAEGSVRDSLSLLDQAIAHSEGAIDTEMVRQMLGLADRGQVLDLFEYVLGGRIQDALLLLSSLYDRGADPMAVVQDLLEATHFLTRLKLAPTAIGFFDGGSAEAARAAEMAAKLSVPTLTRIWSMLLKGLIEVRDATRPLDACEMVLIRLSFAADLPPAGKLVRDVLDGAGSPAGSSAGGQSGVSAGGPSSGGSTAIGSAGPAASAPSGAPRAHLHAVAGGYGSAAMALSEPMQSPMMQAPMVQAPVAAPAAGGKYHTLEDLAALAAANSAPVLKINIETCIHLISLETGRLEFRPSERAPATLAGDLKSKLDAWTGLRWVVSVARAGGAPTLREQKLAAKAARHERVLQEPMVRAVMDRFPGAEIQAVRDIVAEEAPTPAEKDDE